MAILTYDPLKLTGMDLFVLNNNTTYCTVISANHVENTTFMQFLYEVN
jgi:hypothetical protein